MNWTKSRWSFLWLVETRVRGSRREGISPTTRNGAPVEATLALTAEWVARTSSTSWRV